MGLILPSDTEAWVEGLSSSYDKSPRSSVVWSRSSDDSQTAIDGSLETTSDNDQTFQDARQRWPLRKRLMAPIRDTAHTLRSYLESSIYSQSRSDDTAYTKNDARARFTTPSSRRSSHTATQTTVPHSTDQYPSEDRKSHVSDSAHLKATDHTQTSAPAQNPTIKGRVASAAWGTTCSMARIGYNAFGNLFVSVADSHFGPDGDSAAGTTAQTSVAVEEPGVKLSRWRSWYSKARSWLPGSTSEEAESSHGWDGTAAWAGRGMRRVGTGVLSGVFSIVGATAQAIDDEFGCNTEKATDQTKATTDTGVRTVAGAFEAGEVFVGRSQRPTTTSLTGQRAKSTPSRWFSSFRRPMGSTAQTARTTKRPNKLRTTKRASGK